MRWVPCRTALARGPGRAARTDAEPARAGPCARGRAAVGAVGESVYRLFWNPNGIWLACTERDDAPDRIVRRNAYRDSIAGNHFDAEAAHAAAQLCQHLMACVALHAVETAAVDRHDRA